MRSKPQCLRVYARASARASTNAQTRRAASNGSLPVRLRVRARVRARTLPSRLRARALPRLLCPDCAGPRAHRGALHPGLHALRARQRGSIGRMHRERRKPPDGAEQRCGSKSRRRPVTSAWESRRRAVTSARESSDLGFEMAGILQHVAERTALGAQICEGYVHERVVVCDDEDVNGEVALRDRADLSV